MRTRLLLSLICMVNLGVLAQTPSTAIPSDDLILRAMKDELQRSRDKLQLANLQRPFYIEYRVDDLDQYVGEAVFGSLRVKQRNHARVLRVVVRVGDYDHDSYTEREGRVDLAPLEGDELAFRHQLWLATDDAYKSALQSLSTKQAALKRFQTEQQAPDFSHESPHVSISPIEKLKLDEDEWNKLLEKSSGLYRSDPKLETFEASLRAQALNRYFTNSEGTTTRFGSTYYQVDVAGATQADDGMVIQRDHPYVTVNPAELPSWDQLKHDTETVLATLKDLRTAPLVDEEYQGPVLFSNDAASSVFSQLFAPGIAAFKPDPGTTARTKGAYASFFKAKVLPDFINVIDDPTQMEFQHHALTGSYVVDDEGVKSRPVTVVEKGQLLNYIVGREPIRDFLTSNGHGRAPVGGPPLPHIGVLRVTSTQSSSPKDLEAKLIAMCKDQGRPYGYYVETTGPSLTPRLLYRVRVADDKRELVRGAVFGQLDQRALRNDITAVGNDDYIDNSSTGIPETVIAPSILFGELEVKRANPSQEKLPLYSPPAMSQP